MLLKRWRNPKHWCSWCHKDVLVNFALSFIVFFCIYSIIESCHHRTLWCNHDTSLRINFVNGIRFRTNRLFKPTSFHEVRLTATICSVLTVTMLSMLGAYADLRALNFTQRAGSVPQCLVPFFGHFWARVSRLTHEEKRYFASFWMFLSCHIVFVLCFAPTSAAFNKPGFRNENRVVKKVDISMSTFQLPVKSFDARVLFLFGSSIGLRRVSMQTLPLLQLAQFKKQPFVFCIGWFLNAFFFCGRIAERGVV